MNDSHVPASGTGIPASDSSDLAIDSDDPATVSTELPTAYGLARLLLVGEEAIIAFLGFSLYGWAIGEITAPMGIFSAKKDPGTSLFMFVWLCAWTIGGGSAISGWLWMLRGREIVHISPTALAIKRDVFGAGRTKNYDITKVSRLRFAPATTTHSISTGA